MELSGDLSGIRTSQLQELEVLTELKTERSELISAELSAGLSRLTEVWNREIAVFINRAGLVMAVSVGKHDSVILPPLRKRTQWKNIRCIHTHPKGAAILSHLDLNSLEILELESIAAIGVQAGKLSGVQLAYRIAGHDPLVINLRPAELTSFNYVGTKENCTAESASKQDKDSGQEKAFLVGLIDKNSTLDSLNELADLAKTAGLLVVGELVQSAKATNNRSYLGTGKITELVRYLQQVHADVVVCDDELTPTQQRTLEQVTGLKVVDRATLILDIFAQRALSKEGKLQVELAQLKHLLPRLTGQGAALSRLGGGVGTRGPGESKLEMDRRKVRQRLNQLERELTQIRQNREIQRQRRVTSGIPLVTLVGYTNAGKTTFMQRALAETGGGSNAPFGEDKLFATLDPLIRRVKAGSSSELLLSDTVGFIQKLPHELIQSFLATLEEVQNADILLHVLDASHPNAIEQAQTVLEVLRELGCDNKPIVTLLNKTDKVDSSEELRRLAQQLANPVPISLIQEDSLTRVWREIFNIMPLSDVNRL